MSLLKNIYRKYSNESSYKKIYIFYVYIHEFLHNSFHSAHDNSR